MFRKCTFFYVFFLSLFFGIALKYVFFFCRSLFRQRTGCTVLDKPTMWTFTTWLPREALMITCGMCQSQHGPTTCIMDYQGHSVFSATFVSLSLVWAKTWTAGGRVNEVSDMHIVRNSELNCICFCYNYLFMYWSRPMIQEKMNVLEQVGLSESNLSDNALNASFHSKVHYAFVLK